MALCNQLGFAVLTQEFYYLYIYIYKLGHVARCLQISDNNSLQLYCRVSKFYRSYQGRACADQYVLSALSSYIRMDGKPNDVVTDICI